MKPSKPLPRYCRATGTCIGDLPDAQVIDLLDYLDWRGRGSGWGGVGLANKFNTQNVKIGACGIGAMF